MQKQQLEVESVEVEKALEELNKLGEEDVVYKNAGPLLIKTKKSDTIKELEEKKELSKTRLLVPMHGHLCISIFGSDCSKNKSLFFDRSLPILFQER